MLVDIEPTPDANCTLAKTRKNPYKHITSGLPEASLQVTHLAPLVTGWHRGGLEGGPLERLMRLTTTDATLCSSDPPLILLIFSFNQSDLQTPT